MTRIAGFVTAVLLGAASAGAATFTVDGTADAVDAAPGNGTCATAEGACTLRAAVQEANASPGPDVVSLPSGLYLLSLAGSGEDLGASGDLDVTETLEVTGAGADTTLIDGLGLDRIVHALAGLTLRDVTLRRGGEMYGGAVMAMGPGAVTIERVHFEDNRAALGGAIAHAATGTLSITGATFEGNAAVSDDAGAVAFQSPGDLVVADSTFTRNVAPAGDGGAITFMGTGSLTLTNSTFSQNAAENVGGVLATGFAAFTASDCTFDGNRAVSAGGGAIVSNPGPVTVTNVTFSGNTAAQFGGALLQGATVQVSGGEASDNVAVSAFGGLYVVGQTGVSITGTAARRNHAGAGPGGGFFVQADAGAVALSDVEASENAAGLGGGIYAVSAAGDITMTAVRALNNGVGSGQGGGVFATATGALTIADSTVSGNISAGPGGGIFAAASDAVTIQGSTIAQNRAAGPGGLGGGAWFTAGAASSIANTTFSGNVGDTLAGALYTTGDVTVGNATFAGNESPMGSALYNGGGTLTVANTIVVGPAGHCDGAPVTSAGNNIDSDGSCGFAAAGDQTVDPELGPLADNGGPTPTHLPAPGSPAIDGGAPAGCPATDQRGQSRPADGDGDGSATCDVGAVEFLDLCPDDPAKVEPGVCGCGVPDTDASQANGTADCLVNGELKARIARAKAIIGALSGDQDPAEAELGTIGASLTGYMKQYRGQVVVTGPAKKATKLARRAAKAIRRVTRARAGAKLDTARTKAGTALDAFDAVIAPQA